MQSIISEMSGKPGKPRPPRIEKPGPSERPRRYLILQGAYRRTGIKALGYYRVVSGAKCQQEGPGTITFHESEGRSFGQDNQDPGPVGYSPRSPTRSPQKSPGSLNSPSTIIAGKDVSGSQSISASRSVHTTRSGAALSCRRKGHPSPPPCNQLLYFADPAL